LDIYILCLSKDDIIVYCVYYFREDYLIIELIKERLSAKLVFSY